MEEKCFLLKCDKCKWHLEINQACKRPSPCPSCRDYNIFNMARGTRKELEYYIKDKLS